MGENDSLLRIIQLHGFLWESKDQASLKEIFETVGYERLRNAAYQHVIEITNILEGRMSSKSIGMIQKLFLKNIDPDKSPRETSAELRRKMWNYRTWLIKYFDLPLPKQTKTPVYIVDDANIHNSKRFSTETLEKEIQSVDPNSYFAGFILPD